MWSGSLYTVKSNNSQRLALLQHEQLVGSLATANHYWIAKKKKKKKNTTGFKRVEKTESLSHICKFLFVTLEMAFMVPAQLDARDGSPWDSFLLWAPLPSVIFYGLKMISGPLRIDRAGNVVLFGKYSWSSPSPLHPPPPSDAIHINTFTFYCPTASVDGIST